MAAIAPAAIVEDVVKPVQRKEPPSSEPRRVKFNIGSRYIVDTIVGEGAYGVVASATHKPTGLRVAIKKIAPFEHAMFSLRTLREIKLLRHFQENQVSENIIGILDLIRPRSFESFNEVYVIQELMETDMHRVIRTQDLSDDHVQYFTYQCLRALKGIHSADIIHVRPAALWRFSQFLKRDIKPANLLLNANCDLRVCDFGLARSIRTAEPGGETGFMTEYVATRWYRAPEVMLTFRRYTKAIDIWSVGCVVAEMLSGRPLFPGKDYHSQLTLILDILGTPTLEEYHTIDSKRSRDYLRALPFKKRQPFERLFPNASPVAVDFLNRTLCFDPKKRMTVEQALAHPYLEAYHDPLDEPVSPPISDDFFSFDLIKDVSKDDLRTLLYNEVMAFTPTAPF